MNEGKNKQTNQPAVSDPKLAQLTFCLNVLFCLQVVRCICFMNHPVRPIMKDEKSCQIIIPQKEVNRKSGIFLTHFK